MKTRTYTIIYGEDVPCYAMHELQAGHDGEAIAMALAHRWTEGVADPDYDHASNRRIVQIEQGSRSVATDIPLDLDEEEARNCHLRAAAKDLYDALVLARIELDRIFRIDTSEILRLVNAALSKAEGGAT